MGADASRLSALEHQVARALKRVPFGQASAATVASVAQLSDANLPEGYEVYVASVRVPYRLSRVQLGSLPADPSPIKYVPARSGNGTWIQADEGHESWRVARTWLVQASGNDENDGQTAPMQTVTGALRKIGMGRRPRLYNPTGPGPFVVAVQWTGLTFTESVLVDADLGSNGIFQLRFVPQRVRSGTFTAGHFPAAPLASGDDITLTDPAVADWTPWLASGRFRVDITSGPAAGASVWILKNLGGGVARVTYPTAWGGEDAPTGGINPAIAFPCTYDVVQLPHVTGTVEDYVAFNASSPSGRGMLGTTANSFSGFELHDCAIDTWQPQSNSCAIASFIQTAEPNTSVVFAVNTCVGAALALRQGAEIDFWSGGFLGTTFAIQEGNLFFDEGPIFQATRMLGQDLRTTGGMLDVHERGGFFDMAAPWEIDGFVVRIGDDGTFGHGSTSAIFLVDDTPGSALHVKTTARLETTTSAPVEVLRGTGAGTTSTQMPVYTAATGAVGLAEDTTFANILARIAAGGYRSAGGAAIVCPQS